MRGGRWFWWFVILAVVAAIVLLVLFVGSKEPGPTQGPVPRDNPAAAPVS